MLTSLSTSSLVPVIIYHNAQTDKSIILTDNKDKAPAEEPQALREGPGRPFPELVFIFGNIMNHWARAQKIYIGSAVDLSKRLSFYYSPSKLKVADNYISRAILHHTHSAFSLSILEYIDISGPNLSKDEAKTLILFREQYYLDLLLPEYNILKLAGNSLGYKHSEESLAKMNGPEANSGKNNHFYGKSHSAESLVKMSGENNPRGMLGKTHTPESQAKMSAARGTTVYVYNNDKTILVNTFSSTRKAAEYFNCCYHTIKKYALNGLLFQGKWILSTSLITSIGDCSPES
jgi:group I intron endonuclease